MSAHPGIHREPLSEALRLVPEPVRFVVDAARFAPSRGNTQPWRFSWDGARLWLRAADEATRRSTDVQQEETLLALGAALENLVISAAARQLEARITPFPLPDATVVARIQLLDSQATHAEAELWPQIRQRATYRDIGAAQALRGGDVLALVEAARARRTRLELCLYTGMLHELADALGRAEALRLDHPTLRAEALGAVRPGPDNPSAIDGHLLGLPPGCLESLHRGESVGPDIADHVFQRVLASSAVGVLSVDEADPLRWLQAGRAMQRIWLAATERGLALQPLTMPDTLYRVARRHPNTFDRATRVEFTELRAVIDRAFPASAARHRVLTFRLVQATRPGQGPPRRPLGEILELGGPGQLTGIAEA